MLPILSSAKVLIVQNEACTQMFFPEGSMGSRLLKLIAVLAVSLVTFLPLSFAQKTTGDIDGTVTDQSGAMLPGCALTLTDQATGAVRKTTSTAQGSFSRSEERRVGKECRSR